MNRLRMMPSMKQAFQGLEAVNKVLEEVPDLKIGYHGLVSKTDNLKLNHFLTFDMPRLRTISTALKAFSQLWNK